MIDIEPEWVHLSENEDGICMNTYFTEHPEMILGKMEMVSGPYGMETTCMPDTSIPLSEQLAYAISYIEGRIDEIEIEELEEDLIREILPASPDVKNYSYTIIDERVYYREDSIMRPVEASEIIENRIKGMIQIRKKQRSVFWRQKASGRSVAATAIMNSFSAPESRRFLPYGRTDLLIIRIRFILNR